MLRKILLACAFIACGVSQACADPLSIGIAIISIVEVAGGVAIGFEAAAAVGYLALGALAVGLAVASNALTRRPGQDFAASVKAQQSVSLSERQAVPAKRIIYGTAQVGGALFFEQVKAPYLYQGLLLCAQQISGFRKISIGTNQVAILSTGDYLPVDTVTTPQGVLRDGAISATPNYASRLQLSLRAGATSQAIDPLIAAGFSSISSTFRQRGVTTAVFRYHFGANQDEFTDLWGQVQRPSPQMVVDGIPVYDPRDPTQLLDDQTTWKFSNNATLVQTHYLTQDYGGRIPTSKIKWDKVAISADWDDGLVGVRSSYRSLSYDAQTVNFTIGATVTGATSGTTGKITADTDGGTTGTLTLTNVSGQFTDNELLTDSSGGSATVNGTISDVGATAFIKRHTIDGVVTLNQPPIDVLRGMLSANRGRILESGGKVWPASSRPLTPVATISDEILTGAFQYQAAKQKKDIYNRVKCRFIATDQDYQIVDGPILSRADYQTVDGEVLDGTLELPFTLDYRRAERLQKEFLAVSRLGKTISCSVDVSLLCYTADELVGNAVRFDSTLFSHANGIYFVNSVSFDSSYTSIMLSLSEYDASIATDWHPETDEFDFSISKLNTN